eukprot:1279542-Pleurochrysis_carterae.AAC.1
MHSSCCPSTRRGPDAAPGAGPKRSGPAFCNQQVRSNGRPAGLLTERCSIVKSGADRDAVRPHWAAYCISLWDEFRTLTNRLGGGASCYYKHFFASAGSNHDDFKQHVEPTLDARRSILTQTLDCCMTLLVLLVVPTWPEYI